MRTLVRVTLVFLAASSARAQAPDGSDRLIAMAVAESVRVLKTLDQSVRSDSKDAAAWYRRGMVAWTLYTRSLHQPPIRGMYWQSLSGVADTSLRRALEIEPENQQYFLAVARFLLHAGVAIRTYGPYAVFDAEMKKARATGDTAIIVQTAAEVARLHWLRYDRQTCRKVLLGDAIVLPAPSLEASPKTAPNTNVSIDYAGEIDYLKAELLLREAYDLAPSDPRIFHQLAMLLADQRRYRELASFARDHLNHAPGDGWGQMAMGLAQHRIGNFRSASIAFDSGFTLLGDSVRHFLDRFERTLDSTSRAKFAANPGDARTKIEQVYWRNADPIWSVEGTEPRAEFLARVTFAQLRFSATEFSLDGVTSDFGNIYLRTGKWQADPERDGFWRPPGAPRDLRQDLCVPQMNPWYVKGDTTVPEGPRASWGNIARMRIDSIPAQLARFRSGSDSTDILLAIRPPTEIIQRAAQVRGHVRADFWLLAGGVTDVARDSVVPAPNGVQVFRSRVSPGMYVYRSESSADGSLVGARGTAGFIAGDDPRTGFSTNGFGISDVLLAMPLTPTGREVRWNDFSFTPLVGSAARKSQVSLIWENYDLRSIGGSATYDVSIVVKRDTRDRSTTGRIAAAITSRIAGTIGISRSNDSVTFSFSRTAPHASVVPDAITISLGDTPPGEYLLTLRIADRATGSIAGRSQRLVIRAN